MTEQSIQEARAQLTAGEAARQLGPILINRKSDMTIEEEWTPKTVAALEWAIELLAAEQDGKLLHARFPIGKKVYKITHHDHAYFMDGFEYTWADAIRPESPDEKYYLSIVEAMDAFMENAQHKEDENDE